MAKETTDLFGPWWEKSLVNQTGDGGYAVFDLEGIAMLPVFQVRLPDGARITFNSSGVVSVVLFEAKKEGPER